MKIVTPLALLLLAGCVSVDRLGPYELAPARNAPSMTVQPVTLQSVYRASDCNGSVVNGACTASISPEGNIAEATANARSATGE